MTCLSLVLFTGLRKGLVGIWKPEHETVFLIDLHFGGYEYGNVWTCEGCTSLMRAWARSGWESIPWNQF